MTETQKTWDHIDAVAKCIETLSVALFTRAALHDASKLQQPEEEAFEALTPKLSQTTYNSPEYKEFLVQLQPVLKHHYSENRHHPEHFENGIDGMNLVDIIEMFCDWKAATLRHADGDLLKSIEVSKTKHKLSDQLANIFKNSVDLF